MVQRAVEAEGESILLPEAHPISHVEDGLAEHVGVPPELLPVQPHGGEGVEAVEDEA